LGGEGGLGKKVGRAENRRKFKFKFLFHAVGLKVETLPLYQGTAVGAETAPPPRAPQAPPPRRLRENTGDSSFSFMFNILNFKT